MEQATTIGLDIAKQCSSSMERMLRGMCCFASASPAQSSSVPRSAGPVRRRDGSLCRRALLGA